MRTKIGTVLAALLLSLPLLAGCEASQVEAAEIEPVELREADPSPQPNQPTGQAQDEGEAQPVADTAAADEGAAAGKGCCGSANCGAAKGQGCGGGCGCGG